MRKLAKKIATSDKDELVTKGFFEKTLKKALDGAVKKIYFDIIEHVTLNFATKKEMQEMKQELKNDILEFKDEILHEIVGLREDNAIIIHQRQRIDDHEERIEKLETRIYAASMAQ